MQPQLRKTDGKLLPSAVRVVDQEGVAQDLCEMFFVAFPQDNAFLNVITKNVEISVAVGGTHGD